MSVPTAVTVRRSDVVDTVEPRLKMVAEPSLFRLGRVATPPSLKVIVALCIQSSRFGRSNLR